MLIAARSGPRAALALALSLAFAAQAAPARATENGFLAYGAGISTVLPGLLPAPGATWVQSYTTLVTLNRFNGANGHNIAPGFEQEAQASILRVVHAWDFLDLGPFTLASAMAAPLIHYDVHGSGGQDHSGIGDLSAQPLLLGWSSADKSLRLHFQTSFYIPTYNDVSNNVYSVAPGINATWMAAPWLELSGCQTFEFHGAHHQTRYESGDLAITEFGLNSFLPDPIPNLMAGVGGYFIKQISDDQRYGQPFANGFQQTAFALGPQFAYRAPTVFAILKWQRELYAENRSQGSRFWLQLTMPVKPY